jgi:hypothetical protein
MRARPTKNRQFRAGSSAGDGASATRVDYSKPEAKGESSEPKPFVIHRSDILIPLGEREQDQFKECEAVLHAGLGTFFEVGAALLTIRECHLYRTAHPTFDSYCRDQWGMGRSYAWRLIGAAERLKLLPTDDSIPRPTNEFQIRPFLKLQPEVFPKAWEEAIRRAKNGKVTSNSLRMLIAEISPRERPQEINLKRLKRMRYGKAPPGQVLGLLHEAKRRVEKGETEQALAALEKIESLLYGPSVP